MSPEEKAKSVPRELAGTSVWKLKIPHLGIFVAVVHSLLPKHPLPLSMGHPPSRITFHVSHRVRSLPPSTSTFTSTCFQTYRPIPFHRAEIQSDGFLVIAPPIYTAG